MREDLLEASETIANDGTMGRDWVTARGSYR